MDAKKASDIALFNAIGVVISHFIWSPIELIVGILAILAGINGLSKINKEKATSGKWKCIAAIIIGILGILLALLSFFVLTPTGRPPSIR